MRKEKDMNKFKVGDLVRGTNNHYNFTNERMSRARVIEVIDDEQITIEVLEYPSNPFIIGYKFDVESQYFDLVEPVPTESAEKIVLSPDNEEDIDWLTYKASRIVKRLSEKSGMPIERLTSLIVIGAEKLVEIEDGKGKDKGKEE